MDSTTQVPSHFYMHQPQLQPLQTQAEQDALDYINKLDRSFENPDVMNHLSTLSGAQKLALLRDMMQAKADLTAYDNQYGDNLDGVDREQAMLDKNIETLKNDPDIQAFYSQFVTEDIAKELQLPQNQALLKQLEDDYTKDIANGGALYNALYSGKSPEEAMKAYLSEAGMLSGILPPEFIKENAGKAKEVLAQFALDQMLEKQPTPGQMDALLEAAGTGSKPPIDVPDPDAYLNRDPSERVNPQLKVIRDTLAAEGYTPDQVNQMVNAFGPSIQMLVDQTASQMNLTGLDKQKMAADITKTFAAEWKMMRSGLKATDANNGLDKLLGKTTAPAGVDLDAYKSGITHAVQALLGAGSLAAQYAGQVKTPKDVASLVAGSLSQVGTLMEALGKYVNPKNPMPFFSGTGPDSWGDKLNKIFGAGNIEAVGKIVGSLGGLAGAGLSFFSANDALKKGDTAGGVLNIVGGIANGLGSGASFLEGLDALSGGKIAPQFTKLFGTAGAAGAAGVDASTFAQGFFKATLATAGDVLSIVGAGVTFGLFLNDMVKGAKQLDKASVQIDKELKPLIGESPQWVDKPDPSMAY